MANQVYSYDGMTRTATKDDLRPGLILRHGQKKEGELAFLPTFSDCIVQKVQDGEVHLVRPYVYSHLAGTTCPGVLFGTEQFSVSVDRIGHFQVVLLSTGEPSVYSLDRDRG